MSPIECHLSQVAALWQLHELIAAAVPGKLWPRQEAIHV